MEQHLAKGQAAAQPHHARIAEQVGIDSRTEKAGILAHRRHIGETIAGGGNRESHGGIGHRHDRRAGDCAAETLKPGVVRQPQPHMALLQVLETQAQFVDPGREILRQDGVGLSLGQHAHV